MACDQCGADGEDPKTRLCSKCDWERHTRINGWLYLPALGLISSVLYSLLNLFYISRLVWQHFHQYGHVTAYVSFLLLGLLIDLGMTLYASGCFFLRLRKTRRVMVAYYIIGALYAFYLVGIPALLFGSALSGTGIRIIGSALGGLIIWIPYFLRSQRVPQVFSR